MNDTTTKLERVAAGMESRRWHYARNGRVLCGQRVYAGFHPFGSRRGDGRITGGCAKCVAAAGGAAHTKGNG